MLIIADLVICQTVSVVDGKPSRHVYYHKLVSYIRRSLDFTLLARTSFLLFCIAGILQKFIVYGYIPHTANWAMAAGLPRQVVQITAAFHSLVVV